MNLQFLPSLTSKAGTQREKELAYSAARSHIAKSTHHRRRLQDALGSSTAKPLGSSRIAATTAVDDSQAELVSTVLTEQHKYATTDDQEIGNLGETDHLTDHPSLSKHYPPARVPVRSQTSRSRTWNEEEFKHACIQFEVDLKLHKVVHPDPYVQLIKSRSTQEARSLAFFRERTAREWPGYNDELFWTYLAPQIAISYAGVAQMLSAIAAAHEAVESGNSELNVLSFKLGQQGIAFLNQNHADLPVPIIIMYHILVTALSALFSDNSYVRALKSQQVLIDNVRDDEFGLINLVRRHQSRFCQLIDPLPLLRDVVIPDSNPAITKFQTLWHARVSLEQVLNKLAFQRKSGMPLDNLLVARWKRQFDGLRTSMRDLSWLGLKAACEMSLVQIAAMYSDSELVYDQYLDTFQLVADVFASLQGDSPSLHFGIDAGLICMIKWAASWCRDPPLRARLIELMYNSHRIDGVESCHLSALCCDALRKLEQGDIDPYPSHCDDIPEYRRVRDHSLAIYAQSELMRMDFLRYPYTGAVESVWVSFQGYETFRFEDPAHAPSADSEPDWFFGPRSFSFRQPDGTWYSSKASEFYFVLPKV